MAKRKKMVEQEVNGCDGCGKEEPQYPDIAFDESDAEEAGYKAAMQQYRESIRGWLILKWRALPPEPEQTLLYCPTCAPGMAELKARIR